MVSIATHPQVYSKDNSQPSEGTFEVGGSPWKGGRWQRGHGVPTATAPPDALTGLVTQDSGRS